MDSIYQIETRPLARTENILQGDCWRISVLTEGLIRLEYDPDGEFEDGATQVVLNRDFPPADFQKKEENGQIEIVTERVRLLYDGEAFSGHGLSIQVRGRISNYRSIWHYGEPAPNLGGTARTLDNVNGACPLEPGLLSASGFSVLDDSTSLLLTEDGWVKPRKKGGKDLYFWGYGHDYRQCLKDFYYLCGKTPMIPRFALGNWWSRYYAYSEESYKNLMERFDREGVPFSVAVIDMDWHLVDVDLKYGSGWTGYTWNRSLFPDPERFLGWLHQRGMKATLNLHPADGVEPYEEMYEEMAAALGLDPAKQEKINFDICSPEFLNAYFRILHHPNEARGVDFWWMDWQQGKNTRIEGLDPLWMLNHYHYLDLGRTQKRPMIFSRYAGPGSHRYPIGFSGDTHITWESLDFQPYFTATASNIGYGWWSHDIGGHMKGEKDEELMARWLQFGVFSPINRLHSTKDEFYGKEPWCFGPEVRRSMDAFLRLRHQMLPYLYTMNARAFEEDLPIVEPMYYTDPEAPEAYEVKNQYWFGTELIVAPITRPNSRRLHEGKVKVWLPEGIYVDFFTGALYRGGRELLMFRDLNSIPVLAKAGAIVPMTEEISAAEVSSNPSSLVIRVFAGADGAFDLYEDDGSTQAYLQGDCVRTKIRWNWEERLLTITPARGNRSLIPEKRRYRVELWGCQEHPIRTEEKEAFTDQTLEFQFDREDRLQEGFRKDELFAFLDRAEIPYVQKRALYDLMCSKKRYRDDSRRAEGNGDRRGSL